jgi:hypothetical protein
MAAFAACVATSMAQSNVYSLNVVGYHTVTVPGNAYALIANQLNTTNNTLASVIPNPPPNTQFYKYTTGVGYASYQFDEFDLVWAPDGNTTLNPGEGGFIRNPGGSPMSITFVGEVLQGSLTNAVPTGYSIRASKVPQAGGVTSVLQFPAGPNDQVYKYIPNSGYTSFQFDEFDLVWAPSEPNFAVGESFFVNKVAGTNWVRSFTVQ